MTVTPWKYEDQMRFLCPFMESRNTTTNILSPPGSVSPSRSALESPPATPYHRSESQCSTRSSINITSYKIISPQQTKSQFQVSPPYQECQQSLRSSIDSFIYRLPSNCINIEYNIYAIHIVI